MVSIRKNSELSKLFEMLDKSMNVKINTDSVKKFASMFEFDDNLSSSASTTSTILSPGSQVPPVKDNDIERERRREEARAASRAAEEKRLQRVEDYYVRDRENEPMGQEVSDYDKLMDENWQSRKQAQVRTLRSGRRYSKNIPKGKLREAIVWSEILGEPVSKTRHDKN